MTLIEQVQAKLLRHPKRIVFPEGTEPRVIRAAAEYIRRKLGPAILLGKKEEITALAEKLGVSLNRVRIIDPAESADAENFFDLMRRLPRYKAMAPEDVKRTLLNPNYFAAMMLQHGQADGLVGGVTTHQTGAALRPLLSLVAPLPGASVVAGCTVLQVPECNLGDGGLFFLADCGLVPEPTVEELAQIALYTAQTFRQLTGKKPRVAFLSSGTRGIAPSAKGSRIMASVDRAQQLAREGGHEFDIDGELHVDYALGLQETSGEVSQGSGVCHNVLIFPDLHSGSIGSGLVARLSRAQTYGHLLVGLSKPAADVAYFATVDEIVGIAAITGMRAIAYRELYPDQGARPKSGIHKL